MIESGGGGEGDAGEFAAEAGGVALAIRFRAWLDFAQDDSYRRISGAC